MSKNVALNNVVVDLDVYPRSGWSEGTIERYAEALEAGERFPPIILQVGSNRLLDGMHRYRAHLQAGRTQIEVEHHVVPAGMPPKLYAASLSAKHGDRIKKTDLEEVARDTIRANPDFSMKTVAQMFGVTRQTIGRWVGDISERRRAVRKVKAILLTGAGWSNYQTGDFLGVDESTVREDVKSNISPHLTEDLLREALDGLPEETREVANRIREERIFSAWSDEERGLLERLRNHEKTVVVNMHGDGHPNLIRWAKDAELFVKVDRSSKWGNPFEMPDDGSREQVVDKYERYYLPHKPALLSEIGSLKGKALGCWCAPKLCHGDTLVRRIKETND